MRSPAVNTKMRVLILAIALLGVAPPMSPLAQLSGKWWCSTAKGSAVATVYTVAKGEITQHQEWAGSDGKAGGSWDQTFRYDPKTQMWNVRNVGSNGWVFSGTSNDGRDRRIFEIRGTQNDGAAVSPERERYIFDLPSSYSLLWEKQVKGAWTLESYSDCTYAGPGNK
jgi:hypothetical protein